MDECRPAACLPVWRLSAAQVSPAADVNHLPGDEARVRAGQPGDGVGDFFDAASAALIWTTEHRLRGIAYSYVRLEYDREAWPTGIPHWPSQSADDSCLAAAASFFLTMEAEMQAMKTEKTEMKTLLSELLQAQAHESDKMEQDKNEEKRRY